MSSLRPYICCAAVIAANRDAGTVRMGMCAPLPMPNDRCRLKSMTTAELASKTCVPCRGGVPALRGSELQKLSTHVPEWTIEREHHLRRVYTFPDFRTGLEFVNAVGELAEQQGHHPDILLSWGKVEITIWTHKIDGLTESDFILAAKIEQLPRKS